MFQKYRFLLLYNKLQSDFMIFCPLSLYSIHILCDLLFGCLFLARNAHIISMFRRHIQNVSVSLPPPYIHTQRNTWLQEPFTPSYLSVGVKGGGENDVPADGQRGLLHLAPQNGVPHNTRGLSHLLQHLIQALDASNHRALLDVCELGDLCKRLWWDKWDQEREGGGEEGISRGEEVGEGRLGPVA